MFPNLKMMRNETFKTYKLINVVLPQKRLTATGLEPAIPSSEVWCLIH